MFIKSDILSLTKTKLIIKTLVHIISLAKIKVGVMKTNKNQTYTTVKTFISQGFLISFFIILENIP